VVVARRSRVQLVATFSKALVRAAALLIALVVGAWPAMVAAGVALVASGMQAMARHPARRRPLDTAALLAAVNSLPAGERAAIERAASGPVDSLAILRAAIIDDPARWPFDLVEVGGTGYEGGPVADSRWTVVACEAVLINSCTCSPGDRRAYLAAHGEHEGLAQAVAFRAAATCSPRRRRWGTVGRNGWYLRRVWWAASITPSAANRSGCRSAA
jgi:hypothetical protein